jgi:NAD(P)H dehydrogenase (quinone)
MSTLIVYSNTNDKGHCHAILESVKEQLKVKGETFILADLNADKYDPVMYANEHYTAGKHEISQQTKKYREQLSATNKIIYIYPIWWNTMPAIMKGYFDKVFGARFAFKFIKKSYLPFAIPVGLLTDKKAVVIVSTGAQGWMSCLFQGNRFKKIVAHDILGYCGIKAKVYSIHNANKWEDTKKPQVDKLVNKAISWLN